MTASRPYHEYRHERAVAALDALRRAIDPEVIRATLAAYEATGDHDHGRGPIAPGGPCGNGDDCLVRQARRLLALLTLTNDDLDLISDALDSDDYWSSPDVYRRDGFAQEPDEDDTSEEATEQRAMLKRSDALRLRLSTIR